MRQLIVDTETTGLDPKLGHRIIEFAALEMVDRRLTGKFLHFYINPEREIDMDASKIHGIYDKDVKDKPVFAEVLEDIISYISDAELIIHNAKFDIGFLDYQLKLLGFFSTNKYVSGVIDTLALARQKFPGVKNSLDALCDRFKINRKNRGLHGALIDCQLLAEVYLNLTREQISLAGLEKEKVNLDSYFFKSIELTSLNLKIVVPTEDELRSHENILSNLDKSTNGNCLWFNSK